MNQRSEHISALRLGDTIRQRNQSRRSTRNSSLHSLNLDGRQTTLRNSRNHHLKKLALPSLASTTDILASDKSIAESLKQGRKALDAVTAHTKRDDLETSVLSSHRVNNGDVIALVSVMPRGNGNDTSELSPSIFVIRLKHLMSQNESASVDGILSAKEFSSSSLQHLRTMVDASGTYIGLLQNNGKPTINVFKMNLSGDLEKVTTLQARENSRALSDGILSLTVRTDGGTGSSTAIVRGISNIARAPNTLLTKRIEKQSLN